MDENLKQFLKSRNVDEKTITQLEEEKIDENVIKLLPPEKLEEFFPLYGDRIAVLDFCDRKLLSTKKRKQSLIIKIQEKLKLQGKRQVVEEEQRPAKKKVSNAEKATRQIEIGWLNFENTFKKYVQVRARRGGGTRKINIDKNATKEEILCVAKGLFFPKDISVSNAEKATRQIEIGWLNFENTFKKYVQVRARRGGGTRKINIDKNATKEEILCVAKGLFFPKDISPLGPISNYNFDIFDSQEVPLQSGISIREILDATHFSKLRLYLGSQIKDEPASEPVTKDPICIPHTLSNPEDMSTDIIYENVVNFMENEFSSNEMMLPLSVTTPTTILPIDTDCLSDKSENPNLILHRGHIFTELIDYVKENPTMNFSFVEIILPNGQPERAIDSGGVFRDALSEFWSSFYEKCTTGATTKVPYLRHDFSFNEWSAVAKILRKGWEAENYFPFKLAPSFMECCIFGQVFTDTLETFMQYISESEHETIKAAITDFSSVDQEELLEILGTYDLKQIPTEGNLKKLLKEISFKELIQKPKYVIDVWFDQLSGIMDLVMLNDLYKTTVPTAKNILPLLHTESTLNTGETVIFGYLKKFIREADKNQLSAFLRFCTGADVVRQNNIIIQFNDTSGFTRSPTANTCGSILQLPISYEHYLDFRSEMNSVLASNIWIMDNI